MFLHFDSPTRILAFEGVGDFVTLGGYVLEDLTSSYANRLLGIKFRCKAIPGMLGYMLSTKIFGLEAISNYKQGRE